MENASKALIMAGSMLVSLIVISMLVMMFNNISNVKRADAEATATLQASEFNKPYLAYERTLYGSEILSLANLVQDYNRNRTQYDDGYKNLSLTVKFPRDFDVTDPSYFKKNSGGYTADEILKEAKKLEEDVKYFGDQIIAITPDSSSKPFYVKVKNISSMTMSSVMHQYNISAQTYNNVVTKNADYIAYNAYKGLPARVKGAKFNLVKFEYDNRTGRVEKMTFSLAGE